MKKHDLNILLQGYSELWLRTVDRDPEAKINAYQTLHELKSLPWLTATDRLALKLFTLCYYSDHQIAIATAPRRSWRSMSIL